jgi:hypothetical protein
MGLVLAEGSVSVYPHSAGKASNVETLDSLLEMVSANAYLYSLTFNYIMV